LSEIEKALSNTFVQKFPSLVFFFEDASILDDLEDMHKLKLPTWFRETRQTLTFVQPNQDITFQLNYDLNAAIEDTWFRLDYTHAGERDYLSSSGIEFLPFVFASSVSGMFVLSINVANTQDKSIYLYNLDDVTSEESASLSNLIQPILNTYTDFLNQIEIFKLPDGTTYEG
jgi:hypothetical protein